MKRTREGSDFVLASSLPHSDPASTAPASSPLSHNPPSNSHPALNQQQSLRARGEHDTVVVNSPYGTVSRRNGSLGWGSLFQPPKSASLPHLPNVRIGISSLNGVPGRRDRSLPTLLALYRKKFTCLEHCYPYHRVGEADAWASWAALVADSNRGGGTLRTKEHAGGAAARAQQTSGAAPPLQHAPPVATAATGTTTTTTVRPDRFLYAIKANKLLTHTKQAAVDAELEEHIRLFYTDRCWLLGPHMGPVLLQFPPYFERTRVNMARLERVAMLFPQDTVATGTEREDDAGDRAPTTGSPHPPVDGGCGGGGGGRRRRRRVRVAVEFRHPSWYHDDVFALLRRVSWSLVVAHHNDDPTFSTHVDTGTDFLYVRLHGPLGRNVGDYGPLQMRLWAERVVRFLRQGSSSSGGSSDGALVGDREAFVFLNNSDSHVDGTTSSTVDATCLAEEIAKLLPPPPDHERQEPLVEGDVRTAAGTPPRLPANQTTTTTIVVLEEEDTSLLRPPPPPPPPAAEGGGGGCDAVIDVDEASNGVIDVG